MKRTAAWVLAALLLLTAGCGGKRTVKQDPPPPAGAEAPAPAPATPSPPAPPTTPPPLKTIDRRTTTLDQMRTELDAYMNGPGDASPRERLGDLLAQWGVKGMDDGRIATIPLAEADLNGDGVPELVTVINTWGDYGGGPSAAVFVISRQGDRYAVDRSDAPPQAYVDGGALMGVSDLTGDGQLDILWMTRDHGAHTSNERVLVATWTPGQVETLPGEMTTSMAQVRVEGRDILMTGGTVASAGAGLAQRASTFRYRWVDGAFTPVDRSFVPSAYGYHRLLDGMLAEGYGRTSEAEAAYRSALEPGRVALMPEALQPERQAQFGPAVTDLARFRLGLLLLKRGDGPGLQQALAGATGLPKLLASAPSAEAACQQALDWVQATPTFLDALNAPYGYATPRFTQFDICGKGIPAARQ